MAPSVKRKNKTAGMDLSLTITQSTTEDGDTCHNVKSNDYQNQFTGVVRDLYLDESMLDVTLCAAGQKIKAHRMVLSACSNLFQELLCHTNEEQTVFIPEVNPHHLQAIVSFCYNGEIRVPAPEITELLALAQHLKIEGLREVAGLVESDTNNDQEAEEEESYTLEDIQADEDDSDAPQLDNSGASKKSTKGSVNPHNPIRRRKSVQKKIYSDEQLAAAVEDIREGSSLIESARKHKIPRSTLYMRTKTLGIKVNNSKFIYTYDDMRTAIKAVSDGCSLQQAAVMHGIPKTVLWRRIQKEGISLPKRDRRKTYGAEKREAAVKALARGEALSKVASEYKIPKTTLFRDKSRLIYQGKLPSTIWKRQRPEMEEEKRSRLEEAVIACMEGRMSQAAASLAYRIPKTTIWRRLQQTKTPSTSSKNRKRMSNELPKDPHEKGVKAEEFDDNDEEFESYCGDEAEMNITYINEDDMGADPVIILTADDDLNLTDKQNLVVVQETNPEDNFISCEIKNYDDN